MWLVCRFHRSLSVVLAAVAPAPFVVPHSMVWSATECERGGRGGRERQEEEGRGGDMRRKEGEGERRREGGERRK